jgi:hypothetical protein
MFAVDVIDLFVRYARILVEQNTRALTTSPYVMTVLLT